MIKVEIGQITQPANKSLALWTKTSIDETLHSSISRDYGMTLESQESITVNGAKGMKYMFKYSNLPPSLLIYLPSNPTVMYEIAVYPADSNYLGMFEAMLRSLKSSK